MAKLTYINGRGRGEVVRYMLYAAGVTFEEPLLQTNQDLLDLRASGKLILGQVPLLQIDGRNITQTDAIIRYLARTRGLYGANDDQMIECDMVYDGVKDAGLGNSGISFIFKSTEEQALVKHNMKTSAERQFPKFTAILQKNQTGFLVGSKLTFVDVVMAHDLEWFVDCVGQHALDDFPVIKQYRDRLFQHPNIAKFLASPQKKPFPDPAYVQRVRTVFYP